MLAGVTAAGILVILGAGLLFLACGGEFRDTRLPKNAPVLLRIFLGSFGLALVVAGIHLAYKNISGEDGRDSAGNEASMQRTNSSNDADTLPGQDQNQSRPGQSGASERESRPRPPATKTGTSDPSPPRVMPPREQPGVRPTPPPQPNITANCSAVNTGTSIGSSYNVSGSCER